MKTPRASLIVAALAALAAAASLADTRYVDAASASPAAPYTNWATAARAIHVALAAAVSGDEVVVTDGTYVVAAAISVTNGVRVRSVNGPAVTVVDGALSNRCFYLAHSNAVVEGFSITRGNAGGVYISQQGTLRRCIVTGNSSAGNGGGVYCHQGGLLESCLVYDNAALGTIGRGGGVAFYYGGAAESCTIAGNRAPNSGRGGGVSCDHGGTLRNCIIYGNTAAQYPNHYELFGGSYTYCCTTPSVSGTGNKSSDPAFTNAPAGNYRLAAGSPCVDAGTNEAWMVGAVDLDGVPRRIGLTDMGAYEAGQWFCDFSGAPGAGIAQLTVSFTSELLGTNGLGLSYWWDLNGDGAVDLQGPGLDTVTWRYPTGGTYNVRLTVTNALGQGATRVESFLLPPPRVFDVTPQQGVVPLTCVYTAMPDLLATSGLFYAWDLNGDGTTDVTGIDRTVVTGLFGQAGLYSPAVTVSNLAGQIVREVKPGGVRAGPPVHHVSPSGGHVYPYTNWAGAARTIQAALTSAVYGATVLVTNGTYVLGSTIAVTNGITVRSVTGARNTVVDGSNAVLCVQLAHSNAVVEGFTIRRGNGNQGGGVHVDYAGTVRDCIVTGNTAYVGGGVWLYYGGRVRNCLFSRNSATTSGGGIYCFYGGQVESCTVVENQAGNEGGGMVCERGGSVGNTIVYGNGATLHANLISYSSGTNSPVFAQLWTSDPGFIDGVLGPYRLRESSPCVNAGSNQDWMASATDLDGADRVAGGAVDIGAFEYQKLNFDFSAAPRQGPAPLTITFTADPAATNPSGWHFAWDFTHDGTIDAQGVGLQTVTNVYPVGSHTVRLVVSNGFGETATLVRTGLVRAVPPVLYVSRTGWQIYPYTNWLTAARDIRTAVLAGGDGSTVLVSNGTYTLGAEVAVTNAMAVRAAGGPAQPVVDGSNAVRCFWLAHSNAVVEGFRLTRGRSESGGGARVDAGLLQNCTAVSNQARLGAGVYCAPGATVRSCLVHRNAGEAMGFSWGGGIYVAGTIENCTVVSNRSHRGGGVVWEKGSLIRNSIVWTNSSSVSGTNWEPYYGGGACEYSCTTPLMAGPGNIDWAPRFVDHEAGNYRQQPGSFCIDTGTNTAWMAGAVDLDGNPRIVNAAADMGAFEDMSGGFYASPLFGPAYLWVSFEAAIASNDVPVTYFQWDFDGDGAWDLEGTGLASVAHFYPKAGLFDCALAMHRDEGPTNTTVREDYIRIIALPPVSLTITNSPAPFGAPFPLGYGTHAVTWDSVVTNSVQERVDVAGTRRRAAGWRLEQAAAVLEGAGPVAVFDLTNRATLTWNWEIEAHRLQAGAAGPGTVDRPVEEWRAAGSEAALVAQPAAGARFERWAGDVPPGLEGEPSIVLTMDRPRSVVAIFSRLGGFAPDGAPGDWPTFGRDAARAGYQPGLLGTNRFAQRWTVEVLGGLHPAAIGGGRAYLVSAAPAVSAVDALTGSSVWTRALSPGVVGPPTYDGGAVLVQRSGGSNDSHLCSYDAATGATNWLAPYDDADRRLFMAPAAADGAVWVPGGWSGGLCGYDAASGVRRFAVPLEPNGRWTPACLDGRLFSHVGGRFGEHDPLTGAALWSTNLPWVSGTNAMLRTVALDGSGAYAVSESVLYAIDLDGRAVRWSAAGGFLGRTPAVANGLVYALTSTGVVALTAALGLPAGFYPIAAPTDQPIVTDDSLIAASERETRIFDLYGGGLRQVLPAGGGLGLASNMLYIADSCRLVAYALGAPEACRLALRAVGPGSVEAPPGEWHDTNAVVALAARPAPGGRFVAWAGDVPTNLAGRASIELAMDRSRTVVALFAAANGPDYLLDGDWPTFGRSPAHTGYFPGFLGPESSFAPLWRTTVTGNLQQAAVGGGRVYVTPYQKRGDAFAATLDARTGAPVWRRAFATCSSINPPTYDSGAVYLTRNNHDADTQLWSLDAADGSVNWSSPHSAQWYRYMAPAVADGSIWTCGSYDAGVAGFDQATGVKRFEVMLNGMHQHYSWVPSYVAGRLFSFDAGDFRELNPLNGAVLWKISVPWGSLSLIMERTVALDRNWAYVTTMAEPGLHGIDLARQSVRWSAPGLFSRTPALAGDEVYAVTATGIVAFAAADGRELRRYPIEAPTEQPIVTDNILIAAAAAETRVFDLFSGALRQVIPTGGYPSLANGVLYLATEGGDVAAFKVQSRVPFSVSDNVGSFGVGDPWPYGYATNTFEIGTPIETGVTSPWLDGHGARYTCRGWTGTGSAPPQGFTNRASFAIAAPSTLTWDWGIEYWLDLGSTNGSIIGVPPGWVPAGFVYDLYPSNRYGYAFHHWVLDGNDAGTNVPLRLVIDGPHDVEAIYTSAFVNVTTDVGCDFKTFDLSPQTGTFFGTLRLRNRRDSRKILLAPFWYAIRSNDRVCLMHPTGSMPNGMEYVDITAEVLAALPRIGNRDLALDPGEAVLVPGIEIYSRDRSVPGGFLYAVWADPPGATAAGDPARDTDADGMPNGWEEQHALCANDPLDGARDPDGDGVCSLAEYAADTDPGDAGSCLRVLALEPGAAGGLCVLWSGGCCVTQHVDWALAPAGPWTSLWTLLPPSDATNRFEAGASGRSGGFYRIRATGR